jgi:glycosyltransferase involved in cell wall biosynthesis
MKILIFAFDADPPVFGNSKMAWLLSKKLASKGFQVHLLTNSQSRSSAWTFKKKDEVNIVALPPSSKNPLKFIHHLQNVKRFLGSLKFDILHCHGLFSTPFMAHLNKQLKTSLVCTVNGVWPVIKLFSNIRMGLPDTFKFKFCLSKAKAIICSNNFLAKILAKSFSSANVSIVHYGLDEQWLKTTLPTENYDVLFFGDGTRERGLCTFLESIPKILSKRKDVSFTIAIRHWDPNLRAITLRVANRHSVRLLKPPTTYNIIKIASHAKVICLPFEVNSMEPPLSLVESLALGKAVVSTDIGGNKELIGDDERGLLVRPGNAEDIASAILLLLSDESLRRSLGVKAREFIMHLYNWEINVKKIVSIYQGI